MFYVYQLSNPITSIPFYVGVGKLNRRSHCTREQQHIIDAKRFAAGKKVHNPNLHKLRTILKILTAGLEPVISRVASFDNEKDAFDEEIRLIRFYGRADLGTGPLTNLTDGGEGGLNVSAETRAKISAKNKGKPSKLRGRKLGPYSEERKHNISKSVQGRTSPNKGRTMTKPAWNKGLTKETSDSVAKYSKSDPRKGFKTGNIPSNKGKVYVKDSDGNQLCLPKDDPRIISGELTSIFAGRTAWNKGKSVNTKGKTYEEIHGPEKAAELKEKRRLRSLQRWHGKQSS